MRSPRSVVTLVAVLSILPALTALVPTAAATQGGTTLTTDPQGDNAPGGPDTDIVRFGADNDPTYIHFYIDVVDISTITHPNGYQVQFKSADTVAKVYDIVVQYDGRSITSATMIQDTDAQGLYGTRLVGANWTGNQLRIDVLRSDVTMSTDGKTLTGAIAETFPSSTGVNEDVTTPANYLIATGGTAAPLPAVPTAQGSNTQVSLSWTAPYNGGSPITSYKVFRAVTSHAETLLATTTTTSFVDTAVTTGSTYYYQVSAVNGAGESPRGAEATALTVDPTVPGAVRGLVATAGDTRVNLAWTVPLSDGGAPITGYRILKGTVSGGESPLPGLVTTTFTTVTGLQNNQQYFFRVVAVNSVGDGASGLEVSARPNNAAVPPAFEEFQGPGSGAGEPSLGVDQVTGNVYYTSGFIAYNVTNRVANTDPATKGTATWTSMKYPYVPTVLGDPIGFLDANTNRFFQAEILFPPDCSQMSFTDDGGKTWQTSTGACTAGNGHDHETVGGGPFHGEKVPTTSYRDSVYYCAQGNAYATCAISLDGGVTFEPARRIYHTILNGANAVDGAAPEGFCTNLHGHVKVAPDGIVAVPTHNCYKTGASTTTKGGVYSVDDGQNWHIFTIPGSTQSNGEFDPSLSWSRNKAPGAQYYRLWYAYTDGDRKIKATYSDDLGATWATSVDVGSTGSIVNAQFAEMQAGDFDRAAVGFLGSTTSGDNQATTFTGVWDAYVAITTNGGASYQLAKVSADPVQKGCISAGGTTSSGCRNLLDFNDLQMDKTGRVAFAYADGCTSPGCTTPAGATNAASGSTNDAPTLGYQTAGRGLLSAFDAAVTVPEAPVLRAAIGDRLVRLEWTPPANGNSPLTGYQLTRDGVALATLGLVTTYDDRTVTNGITYSYTIAAVNAVGAGPASAPVAATPAIDITPPTQVTNLQVTAARDGSVSLLWDAASDANGIDHYVVARDGVDVGSTTGSVTAFTQGGLQNGRTYSFTVRAFDASNNVGPASAPLSAKPVRVPTATFIASDPQGDSTGPGATDLLQFGFLTDATTIRSEWKVVNVSSLPASKVVYFVVTFGVGAVKYDVEYDLGGTRCFAYRDAGGVGAAGIAGSCGFDTTTNTVWFNIPRASLDAQYTDPAAFSLSAIATGTINSSTSSARNDAIGGTFTYTSGTPASAAPPTFDALGTKNGAEASVLAFTVHATDLNGDYVTYSSANLPAGATLDSNTGAFSWTPTYDQAGNYSTTFRADSGAASSTTTITIAIANVNRPPVLAPVGNKAVASGSTLTVQLSATDPDSDVLTYGATNLPPGATFNTTTGTLSYTPPVHTSQVFSGIVLSATDGQLTASETIAITVTDVNTAPVLDAIADVSIPEGGSTSFTVHATDAEGDLITYAVTGAPPGATLNATTGAFSYAAPFAAGHASPVYALHFTASDGTLSGARDSNLTVTDVNRAPTLLAPASVSGVEAQPIAFTVSASDADGDATTLAATGLPAGATFDPATGMFSWTPTYDQAGIYAVNFSATDGLATTTQAVPITVGNVNRAPVFDPVTDQNGAEGSPLAFSVRATDPDGDAVTLSASGLPSGASFNASTGTFSWTPSYQQAGTYVVTFAATDGSLTTSQPVNVIIANVNTVPVIQSVPDRSVNEGATLTFNVTATDKDGDALTYSMVNGPAGSTFNASTRTFSWTPALGSGGYYPNVQFSVTDGVNTVSTTTNITVLNIARTPTLAAIANATTTELGTTNVSISATSPSGEAIVLTMTGLPSWATLTDLGAGKGRITLSAPLATAGSYSGTVFATTAGTFVSTRTINVTVLQASAVTVVAVGNVSIQTPPSVTLTLTATVTNTGPEADNFTLTTATTGGWAKTSLPNVALAPGESVTVTFTVRVPADGVSSIATLTARSIANPNVSKIAGWSITVPIIVKLTPDAANFGPAESVRGNVTVTYIDGSPVANAAVILTQTPRTGGAPFASKVTGRTDATGHFAFDFGTDALSRVLGAHDLRVVVTAATTAVATSTYTVGP